ncbi:MAG TPA: thiol:disulfide interchange protein DsbG [Burkholderiales bacterium]|nr:thiol:disulfide interchange protein DsbG [Burkholderiales bacterium]
MIRKPSVLFAALFALPVMALAAGPANWPAPVKAIEAQGVEIIGSFAAPGGLKAYAGIVQQHPLAIYVTADGQHAIVGTLIDAKGENLSRAPLERMVSKPLTARIWSQLDKSTWIADGSKSAARIVYVFTDPNCPYCDKFWNDARPWVKAGKVQLRHVLVGILTNTSAGKAAALLSAKDPQAALTRHEQQRASGDVKPLSEIPVEIRAQLDANQTLMEQLGSSATPTIFYKDAHGNLQKVEGAPSAEMLSTILGPR